MESILDKNDYLLLKNLVYDGTTLNVVVNGVIRNQQQKNFTISFKLVSAFFVLEEAVDALSYSSSKFNRDVGFLKVFSQKIDPADKLWGLTELMPNADLYHYRLITNDEIVHVIANTKPNLECIEE